MNKSKFSLDIEQENNRITIDRKALQNFARGAIAHSVINVNEEIDWQKADPNELPSYNFRLRLNQYQIGLLKHIAHLEKRSVSNVIKVTLINELIKKLT